MARSQSFKLFRNGHQIGSATFSAPTAAAAKRLGGRILGAARRARPNPSKKRKRRRLSAIRFRRRRVVRRKRR